MCYSFRHSTYDAIDGLTCTIHSSESTKSNVENPRSRRQRILSSAHLSYTSSGCATTSAMRLVMVMWLPRMITLSSDSISVAAVWWHLLTLDLMRPTIIIITSLPAFDYNANLIFYSCTHPKQFPFAKDLWCSSNLLPLAVISSSQQPHLITASSTS